MLIGEICKKSELSRDTIRYYEKRGLLNVEVSNSEFNNYKNYSEENLKRLLLIKKSKTFGFTLNEIYDLLYLVDNKKANCSIIKQKVLTNLRGIDKKIQELEEMKALIKSSFQLAQNQCSGNNLNENCKAVII